MEYSLVLFKLASRICIDHLKHFLSLFQIIRCLALINFLLSLSLNMVEKICLILWYVFCLFVILHFIYIYIYIPESLLQNLMLKFIIFTRNASLLTFLQLAGYNKFQLVYLESKNKSVFKIANSCLQFLVGFFSKVQLIFLR